MPNLIVEYRRSNGETVADAMVAVREAVAEKQQEVDAAFATDPAWQEDGAWVIARWPYKFSSPEQRVVLEKVVLGVEPVEEEPEEAPKPKRSLFGLRSNNS